MLAHQYLDQGSSSLRASLAANTAIKFASGLSAQDATAMARDMRTSAEFIMSQPKLQFAAHIRHVTPEAVSIPIKPVKNPPMLSDNSFENWLDRNRANVSPGFTPHFEYRAPRAEAPVERKEPPSEPSPYEQLMAYLSPQQPNEDFSTD